MKKINYSTNYANSNDINGYVIAVEKNDYYVINKTQYNRAVSKLSIAGVKPNFHADKPVIVIDENGNEI